jgi:hypothetical protein
MSGLDHSIIREDFKDIRSLTRRGSFETVQPASRKLSLKSAEHTAQLFTAGEKLILCIAPTESIEEGTLILEDREENSAPGWRTQPMS